MPENSSTRDRANSVKIFTSFHNYYELLDTRASGSFATVKLGRYSITGEQVAVKIVNKTKLDKVAISHLTSETSCLRLIKHPNVVRLYDLYESKSKLYLVMELGDGDLYQHIMSHYKDLGMPEDSVRFFFRQIVSALDYCHKIKIVHRDLKPQNIIIFKSTNVVKLADFGFSRVCAPEHYLNTTCGSLPYTAPEVFLDESYDPRKSDIWSVAVILCIMLTGQVPFDHVNQSEMLTMVLDCNYNLPSFVSQEAKELVSKLLKRKPEERLSLSAIFMSSFYKDNAEELEALEGKTIFISKVLHRYVVSEIIQNQIATHKDVLQSLLNKRCDFVSAAYHLIANDAFKKANNSDTVNYVLVVDEAVIQEELQVLTVHEAKSSADINLMTNDNRNSNVNIFKEISMSMEDVTLCCSPLLKSHSLRQPRKKKTPYMDTLQVNESQNHLSTTNVENNNRIDGTNTVCGIRSVRSVQLKNLPQKSLSKSRFRRSNSPGLQSLSEMALSEQSTEHSNPKYDVSADSNSSSNTVASEKAFNISSKPSIHIPSMESDTNPIESSDIIHRTAYSSSSDINETKNGGLSPLIDENVICRTKSLNNKSKKRFIDIFSSKK